MPSFSQESMKELSTCHIDLQVIFFNVVRTFDCKVIEGYRNEERQNIAFQDGKSKLKYPDGKHNNLPSMAVDVAPWPVDWKDIKRFYYFAGYVMGIASKLKDEGKIEHSLRWGGDWDSDTIVTDQQFNDLVHYELIT